MAVVRRKSQKSKAETKPKKKPRGAPFQKGNGGRPKGAKGKFTDLRAAFIDAFQQIGGADELANWGKKAKNRTAFYNMICKMLPKEVVLQNPGDAPESLPFKVQIVGDK